MLNVISRESSYITVTRASQITSDSTVCDECDQAKHAGHIEALYYWTFVRRNHWGTVDSPHKWTEIQKTFACPDVIMIDAATVYLRRYTHSSRFVLICCFVEGQFNQVNPVASTFFLHKLWRTFLKWALIFTNFSWRRYLCLIPQ